MEKSDLTNEDGEEEEEYGEEEGPEDERSGYNCDTTADDFEVSIQILGSCSDKGYYRRNDSTLAELKNMIADDNKIEVG